MPFGRRAALVAQLPWKVAIHLKPISDSRRESHATSKPSASSVSWNSGDRRCDECWSARSAEYGHLPATMISGTKSSEASSWVRFE